ncbi:MAG TPA: DUF4340 domain-containing protein [Chthoniobacterales bacterium]|jgi:hypothetical protein|nr:DUF4340 domain-containing protein [Chthoniobacterales bacterium]
MKTKTTLILLIVAVAVAAYIKFYESKRPNTDEAKRQAQNVVNFERDKLDGIVIQNGDDRIELRKQDLKWRIEAPFKDQADRGVVEHLIADLDGWQKFDSIPASEIEKNKSRLDEYGLSKGKLKLKLLGKDVPPEITFGNDAALQGKMYVRVGDGNDVIIAAQSVRNDIAKKPEDFRDKKLTDLSPLQVTRALVKSGAGEIELEKKADHWEVIKPLKARGDDQKITDILAQVTTAQIQQFVAEDRGDLRPYGLAEPRGSITLFRADDQTGQTLQIGAPAGPGEKEKDQVYVRFTARNAVYTLPKKIEEILALKPADLRDRHLVRIDTNILDRITIDAPGKSKTVLARKDDAWTIVSRNNQPANASEANRMLEMLKAEQVTKFVEDVASDLPKYGLDKPQLQVVFSSFASENTPESTAGEQAFATISFGKVEGDNVFARLGDEPFIVAVRRTLLDNIFADPLQWQELAVFRFKPDDVHKLAVQTDRESALVRNDKKEWTWVNGTEPINTVNVQSLLNTLTVLRGVRWIGPTTPAHGFDKPQATITFTTSPDDKSVHKLVIGGAAEGGMWFARTDEREGTFVVNNPDLNALKLPLAAAPAPSPAASPGGTPLAAATPTPKG